MPATGRRSPERPASGRRERQLVVAQVQSWRTELATAAPSWIGAVRACDGLAGNILSQAADLDRSRRS